MLKKKTFALSLVVSLVFSLFFVTQVHAANPLNLYTNGTLIYNGYGRIQLRGTQVDSNTAYEGHHLPYILNPYTGSPRTAWFEQGDVQWLASHGGNVMELQSQFWHDLEPTQGNPDVTWFQNHLDKWVSWLQAAGVYTEISFSNIVSDFGIPDWVKALDGNPSASQLECDFWNPDDHTMDAARADYANLFAWMANRYINNPYVYFAVGTNEPFNGNTITNYDSPTYSGYYATVCGQVIDAIRAINPGVLVWVDFPYSGQLDQVVDVNRQNIVWELHAYVNEPSAPSSGFQLSGWENYVNQGIQVFMNDFGKPLFMGEYGFIYYDTGMIDDTFPNWQSVLTTQVNFMDSHNIAGRQWHELPMLYNEWYSYHYGGLFTQAESNTLLDIVSNGQSPNPSSTPTPSSSPTPSSNPTPSSSPTPSSTSSSLKVLAEVSTTVATGQTWAFSVQVSGGSIPYSYQWYEGTTPLSSQNSGSLTISKNTAGTYTYYCRVTDAKGTTTTSNTVTLTVISTQQTTLPPNTTPPPSSTTSPTASTPTPPPVSPSTTETYIIASAVVITTIITGPLTSVLRKRRNSHSDPPSTPK